MRLKNSQLTSLLRYFIVALMTCMPGAVAAQDSDQGAESVRVMTWNIWHGGREDGDKVGPDRVVDVIRDSGADIVAMQETYGSGEQISSELKFHFAPRGTNVSIHSRWPVVDDISVFEAFKCVGALVKLPSGKHIAVYSIWLPYGEDIWLPEIRDDRTTQQWLEACAPSATDLKKITAAIRKRLSTIKQKVHGVFLAGDFNSMSHLDYTETNTDFYEQWVRWNTSRIATEAGYIDAFREVNPGVNRSSDRTWSPRFPEQLQERIDYVYYDSDTFRPTEARNIEQHDEKFPSDHAAVLVEFQSVGLDEIPTQHELRVATYNIRHGAGSDGKLDLDRTAKCIRELEASIVAVQEIDMNCERSKSVNQMRQLGKSLGMYASFASFMPYGGGNYGLGMLTKWPVCDVESVRLPAGREPRVALVVTMQLPGGQRIRAVSLHFDWVADDIVRFQQGSELLQWLEAKETALPTIVMGDFNDQPESRTLSAFREQFVEADKPRDARFTWPADASKTEIDFIFVDRQSSWRDLSSRVVAGKIASDHCPVVAQVTLISSDASVNEE